MPAWLHIDPSWLLHVADVLIVAYFIYRALLVIRGTRAAPMLWGLGLVVLVYFGARQIGLNTLAWILSNFLSSIILVVVILFQDELRRALTKVGLHSFFHRNGVPIEKPVEDIVLAAEKLSSQKLGALIVMQMQVGLDEFLEEGSPLDALINRKLLFSIFLKESPLHDGAVVIEGERIRAAGCVLPLSFNPDLDPSLGTRHRAALGITERTDAVVIVVSEENGSISLAREGRLSRNLDGAILRETLQRMLESEGAD